MLLKFFRRKKGQLKRRTDRRFRGLYMGPPPDLLAQKDLHIGDVLFCGQANAEKRTALIQNSTDGIYVHCALYIENGLVVDIVKKEGIRELPFEEFIKKYTYVAVTRYPGVKRDKRRQAKIFQFAMAAIKKGYKYNSIGAILLPLREYFHIQRAYDFGIGGNLRQLRDQKKFQGANRLFCSEFIITCYVEVGLIPKDDLFLRPHLWSPNGLAEENIFEFVGYVTNTNLQAVDKDDQFLAGNGWVLTPEGQKKLRRRQEEMREYLAQLPPRIP